MPYNLFPYSGYYLGGEQLNLTQPIVSGPVDEGVHTNLNDQACEFIYPIVYRASEEILHGTRGDEAHDIIDPANVLWPTTNRQRCLVDALPHLWEALRWCVGAAGKPPIRHPPGESQCAWAIGAEPESDGVSWARTRMSAFHAIMLALKAQSLVVVPESMNDLYGFFQCLNRLALAASRSAHRLDPCTKGAGPQTKLKASTAEYIQGRRSFGKHGGRTQRQIRDIGKNMHTLRGLQ